MHFNGFHLLQEEYFSELDCNTIKIDDYSSDKFKNFSLYSKQESGFNVLVNNSKAVLNRPCGSGKSLITSFSTGWCIHHNPNLKAIIAVPQKIITKTFQKKRMIYPNGLQVDWDFQNFCDDDSVTKIQDLIAFLKKKDFGTSMYERIVLVSHASLARCYEYIKDEKDIFNNVILAIDEAHHVLYHSEKGNDNIITNGLGNIINHALSNDDGTGYIWPITATPFRGDNACIIPDDVLSTFAESYLPFHEHWKTMKYLKEIKIDFMLYEQGKILDYVETVYKNNMDKKILIYCPYNGYLLNGITKLEFKDQIIDLIKRFKPDANILDLVETKNRDQRKMVLYDEEESKTIDVVLNCKIFNEGADWISNNFVIDLTPSDNLRLSNQKTGRPMRDFKGKKIVTYIYFLPKEAKFANEEERRLHLSKSFNILAATMIIKDQLQPLKYPTKKGDKKQLNKYSNPLLEVFPNDNKKTQFINKVITKLIELKEIFGENPKKDEVFSIIENCLNIENIVENQEEITEYTLGMIYDFQPSLNSNSSNTDTPTPKKPKWINEGRDISFLIKEGFDKVMEQIYENLLTYSTGVFGVKTFEELRERICSEYKDIIEHVKDAERLAKENGGLLPCNLDLKKMGFTALITAKHFYPEHFNHIKQKTFYKTIEEHVSFAEQLAKENKGVLPCYKKLIEMKHRGLYYIMKKHPKAFEHIKQERNRKPLEEHVKDAERLAKENGGGLPSSAKLKKMGFDNLKAMLYVNPEAFEHIKREKDRKPLDDHVKDAERLAKENGGVLPGVSKLKKMGFTALLAAKHSHPEDFAHIKQKQFYKPLEEHVKDAERLAKENEGVLPGVSKLNNMGFKALIAAKYSHPEAFAHI